jgi:hypothetical protein
MTGPELFVITEFHCTVKPLYNDHPWDPKKWPLLTSGRCSKYIYVIYKLLLGPQNDGRFRQVVAVRRWLLAQV